MTWNALKWPQNDLKLHISKKNPDWPFNLKTQPKNDISAKPSSYYKSVRLAGHLGKRPYESEAVFRFDFLPFGETPENNDQVDQIRCYQRTGWRVERRCLQPWYVDFEHWCGWGVFEAWGFWRVFREESGSRDEVWFLGNTGWLGKSVAEMLEMHRNDRKWLDDLFWLKNHLFWPEILIC